MTCEHGTTPIRIAVVGCGEIAQAAHLPALCGIEGIELAVVCDPDRDRLTSAARRNGIARTAGHWRDVVADDDVDAVAVLTRSHRDAALAAARAGKHLFVEKPLAFTSAAAREIAVATAAAGVTLCVGYMKQHDAGWQFARRQLRKDLADVRFIRLHNSMGGTKAWREGLALGSPRPAGPNEFGEETPQVRGTLRSIYEPARGRFWTLVMLGIHDLSLLHSVAGTDIVPLSSVGIGQNGLVALLRTRHGIPVSLELDRHRRGGDFRESATFFGHHRNVRIRFGHPYLRPSATRVCIEEFSPRAKPSTRCWTFHTDCFREEWLHFRDRVRSGNRSPAAGVAAAEDLALAERLLLSCTPLDPIGAQQAAPGVNQRSGSP